MSKRSQSFIGNGHLAGLTTLSKEASSTNNFRNFVKRSLKFLQGCGFQSARYYECALSPSEKDQLLILSEQVGGTGKAQIGFSIRYGLSTLGNSGDQYTPCIGSSADTNEAWVGALGLSSDSAWADIPVMSSNRLIGLLAVDWRGAKDMLSQSDVGVLSVLGALVASVSESVSSADADKVEKAFIDALEKREYDIAAALELAIDELVSTMEFAVVATFQLSQGGGRLTKIVERVHPNIGMKVPEFPEEYPVGKYLTGLAWDKADIRYIADFSAHTQHRGHDVERKSFDRHTAVLGEVKSILYSKIDNREPSFMIRVMNCVSSGLPIVEAQRKIVERITRTIASHIDDVLAKKRLEQVSAIAGAASRNITRPGEVVSQVRLAVQTEGFEDLIVIAGHKEQEIGALFCDFPKSIGSMQLGGLEWSIPGMVEIMSGDPGVAKINLITNLMKNSDIPFLKAIKNLGYEVLVTATFGSSAIKGFMAIPCKEVLRVPRSGGRSGAVKIPKFLIKTYAEMICSSVDGFDQHIAVQGSRKFMGRIGHEVRMPAIDSAQSSIQALALAQRAISMIPEASAVVLSGLLDEAIHTVNQKAREIERMMEFAKLAALQEVGSIQFKFEKIGVERFLGDLSESLRRQRELVAVDQAGTSRECVIVFNKSVSNMGALVADEMYLKVILSHLLKNAAKYSLPRISGRGMEIHIIARPDPNMVILQVSNWGLGIDPQEFETIFRPHVRGAAHDRRKAIPGLGLGLYVSRLLANAHKGTLFCERSVPTLSDPVRAARYEGYETVFELRLPKNRPEGILEIDLGT